MRNDRVFRAALLGALALVIVLLVVVLLQVHHLEQRFITQGQQLRALGEATDRLSAGGLRPQVGPAATSNAPPGVKLLHPEVENFFKPADTHWPVPGASLDGTFVRGWWTGDPKGWNPLLENSSVPIEFAEYNVVYQLGERNAWTNPDHWHGEAAWRLEITDDSKEFTFYLKPGMTWHEPAGVNLDDPKYAWLRGPHPYTAEDFVFTVDLTLDPAVQSGPLRNYFQELESWKAVDPLTLVLRWKKKQFTNLSFSIAGIIPVPKFIYAFDENGKPLPPETIGTQFNRHWYNNKAVLGAGPYRMASYVPGSKVVLERNEAFVGEKPAIKNLVYPIYTDVNQTLLRLKAHEVTFGELQAGQYREEVLRYKDAAQKPASPFLDGRITCSPQPENSYRYIGWNQQRPFFSDKRVRRALTLAFDRAGILEKVYNGLGTLTTHPYGPNSTFHDPSIKPLPFDLAASRKLLTEAGWTDSDGDGLVDKDLDGSGKRTPFEFTLLISNARKESRIAADILREDLLKVGVKMNVDSVEWSLFVKRMDEKTFDAFFGAWALLWEPDLFQVFHSSQADLPKGSNRVGFRNKEADAIIEALRVTIDRAERTRYLQQFHRLFVEEQAFSTFMSPKLVYCWWGELENVSFQKIFPATNVWPWWVAKGR
jgi:peptide/nickel transport system substrate-binding protein